jgi:hypothetical protein
LIHFAVEGSPLDAYLQFIAFLEDRRVLFRPLDHEIRQEVDISVDQIRSHCSELIATLDGESPAVLAARGIRRACRTFLEEPRVHLNNLDHDRAGFFLALGQFRATVGLHLAALAEYYKVMVADDLASILPKSLEDD